MHNHCDQRPRGWLRWLGILAAIAGLALDARFAPANQPHVVIILLDDLGYGDPGCYNPASKIRTPNIDRVAAAGMRFTDAHAPGPLCHLSRYGLLTGRYPFRTEVQKWREQPTIAPEQTTLASLLQSQGYRTAMVGKWHLGFSEQGYDQPLPGGPVDRGFSSFFGIRASTDIPPYFYIRDRQAVQPPIEPIEASVSEGWSPIQGKFWRAGLIAPDMKLEDVLPRFTEEAVAVIEQHSQQRAEESLFLYLAYPAPHTPWLPSDEFAGQSEAGLYGDFTEMVDAMVGKILEALDRAQMSDETLLIVTSDNGPVWYAGDVQRFDHDACGGWRGMKSDAWEAGHRMPFLVRWPGRVAAGSVSDQLICFTDLLATLATITKYPLQPADGPDSFDFSSVLLGNPQPADLRTSLPLQSGGGVRTLRDGQWKLIEGLGSGGFSEPRRVAPVPDGPRVQLYNLQQDPAESANQAQAFPQIVERLQKQLRDIEAADRHRG